MMPVFIFSFEIYLKYTTDYYSPNTFVEDIIQGVYSVCIINLTEDSLSSYVSHVHESVNASSSVLVLSV